MDERAASLPGGVMISVLTGMAYLTAFAHEVGAARAFGIPIELIDLQLLPSLFGTLVSLSVLVIFLQAADPLVALLTPKADEHPVLTIVRPGFAVWVSVFLLWFVGGRTIFPWRWWVGPLLFPLATFILVPLATPLLYRRVPGGYVAKLRASNQVNAALQGPLNRLLFGSFGWLTVVLLLSALLGALSFTAGYSGSKRQEEFFTTNQQPGAVVLRIYGDRIIAAEFVRNEKRIKRLYQVLRVDSAGLVLRKEAIGPLSLDD